MIDLFEHNQRAYQSAITMLQETGKAAIIHPTGTGKSFIGFKLCEEFSDKRVCWLCPSEYIFKTQIENIKCVTDGYEPINVSFFTYAKLSNLSDEDLNQILPDFIVLDEFHRVGAEVWGMGVQRLLSIYKGVPVLGFSATAVRYLDNQRDMSDELFDGNVASHITLGEAIVKGILNPPKYILSMYSYKKQFERLENRVRSNKNPAVRGEGEKYLEALRRTLEKADGLEEIFDKYMTERRGKYIVFCANFEHMQEMMAKAKEWFYKVDKDSKIYSVYSFDPEATKSFAKFKDDGDDSHLRLLYCIDALNEGIHLEDISGVILLRPTVSPIIYKQQIGRALSVSKRRNAVIFDIVMNIDNLYSIGAIEEEMQIATSYYRSLGEDEVIVNERFQIIDKLKDCREIFDKLERTLTASWEVMYGYAKRYFEQYGNLEVPARYRTEDGYALGSWIFNQKGIRKGQIDGTLTQEQIQKLDQISMIWGSYNDLNWDKNFNIAKRFYEEEGHLDVPTDFVFDGVSLGQWLSYLRSWERSGAHPKYLTKERKCELESIGMIWDKLDFYWEKNYLSAFEYFKQNRNLDVPVKYVDKDGVRLGSWIMRLRGLRAGKMTGTPLTDEQIARLDDIGMVWGSAADNRWEKGFREAKEYKKANGNLLVPSAYKSISGFQLGAWIQRQRLVFKQGKMQNIRKKRLDDIGMVWQVDGWESRFELVKDYYEKNGDLNISQATVEKGVWLGKWLAEQKRALKSGKLSDEQIKMLLSLPIEQVESKDETWFSIYEEAKSFWQNHGNLNVPIDYKSKNGVNLAMWLTRQRRAFNLGKLSEQRAGLLSEIGMVWNRENYWDKGYRHAKEFFEKNGNLQMSQRYKCDDGFALGVWVFDYRKAYNRLKTKTAISAEQIKLLEEIGMDWQSTRTKQI